MPNLVGILPRAWRHHPWPARRMRLSFHGVPAAVTTTLLLQGLVAPATRLSSIGTGIVRTEGAVEFDERSLEITSDEGDDYSRAAWDGGPGGLPLMGVN